MEVARGIHRVEADLGERYVCQYLLTGEERTLCLLYTSDAADE